MSITLTPAEDFTLEVRTVLGTTGIGGSGAAGNVAVWLDATNLTNDSVFVWDSANHRLGIGTGSPAYPFHLTSSVGTTGLDFIAQATELTTSSADTTTRYAHLCNVYASLTSGAIASINGYYSEVDATGSGGTVTSTKNFSAGSSVASGSTITTRYSFFVGNTTGAGSVGTQYGLYIQDLTKGATNYGIYSVGSTPSYFGGKVGIGQQPAGKQLDVRTEAVVAQDGTAGAILISAAATGASISTNTAYDASSPATGWTAALDILAAGITANSGLFYMSRPSNFASNGVYWGAHVKDVGGTTNTILGNSGSAYTTGGALSWVGNSMAFLSASGSELRVGLAGGSTPLMAMTSTGVGIFCTGALYPLTVSQNVSVPRTHLSGTEAHFIAVDSGTTRVLVDAYGATPNVNFRHATNTNASPSASTSGTTIANIAAFGYGSTSYSGAGRAQIQAVATETWTDAAQGTKVAIQTTATGGTTTGDKLVVENDGQLSNTLVTLAGKNPGVFFIQTADSTTTANSLTTMLGTGSGTLTLPANFLTVGRTVKIRLGGYVSTADGGAGTKTVTLTLGGTTIATATSGATFTTVSNAGWIAEAIFTCRTTGASGSVQAGGYWTTQIASANNPGVVILSTSATTINTTGTLAIDYRFNNGNATGAIRTTYAVVEWKY